MLALDIVFVSPQAIAFQACDLLAQALAIDSKILTAYSSRLILEKGEKDGQSKHDQQGDFTHDGVELPLRDEAKLEAGMVGKDDEWKVKPDFLRAKYGMLASWIPTVTSEMTIDKDGDVWKRAIAWTWGFLCKIEEFHDGSRKGGVLLFGYFMIGTF